MTSRIHQDNRRSEKHVHDQLGVVMAQARQQVPGSPLQEVVQRVAWTLLHTDLIAVAPDLQTGQRHTDVQRTVELKQEEEVLLSQQSDSDLHLKEVWTLTQSTWLATSSMR